MEQEKKGWAHLAKNNSFSSEKSGEREREEKRRREGGKEGERERGGN